MFQRIFVLREGFPQTQQGTLLAERMAHVSGGTVLLPPASSVSLSGASLQQPGPEMMERGSVPEGSLVLMTGPGCATVDAWRLEHVAQSVASHPPGPVLLLREGETALSRAPLDMTPPPHPVIAAVALDGSRQAEAALVPTAHLITQLSAPAKGSLHLTRVVLRSDVDVLLHDRERVDPNLRDQMMREAMDYLHQITNELHRSLGRELGLTITWSIALDSDVVNALVDVAERSHVIGGTCLFGGCDLLALATHRRDPQGYWIPGNVTGHLFTTTNLPLLLV